jgi:hypothetical protein
MINVIIPWLYKKPRKVNFNPTRAKMTDRIPIENIINPAIVQIGLFIVKFLIPQINGLLIKKLSNLFKFT